MSEYDADQDIPRPDSCPPEGLILLFDAGWDCHRLGMSRQAVCRITQGDVRMPENWATLAWDIRETLEKHYGV